MVTCFSSFLATNKLQKYIFSDNHLLCSISMLPIHFSLTLFSLLTPDTEKPKSKTWNIFTFMPSTDCKYCLAHSPTTYHPLDYPCCLLNTPNLHPISFFCLHYYYMHIITSHYAQLHNKLNSSISYFDLACNLTIMTITYFDLIHTYFLCPYKVWCG